MKRVAVMLVALFLLVGATVARVAAAEPSGGEAVGRGLLYLQLGLQEMALSQLEAAAQREGASADTLVLYGLLLEVTGRTGKAAEVLAAAERRVESEGGASLTAAEVRTFAAGALAAGGATGEASQKYASAVADEAGLGLAHAGLAALLDAQGQATQAIKEYERYLELSPDDGAAWAALGRLYASGGRTAEAIEALERALRLNPGLSGAVELMHRLKEQAE